MVLVPGTILLLLQSENYLTLKLNDHFPNTGTYCVQYGIKFYLPIIQNLDMFAQEGSTICLTADCKTDRPPELDQ